MTKKLIITTDFTSKLSLFKLDRKILNNLKKRHKNIIIKKIDPKKVKQDKKSSIYWGTRINDRIIDLLPNLKWVHFGSIGADKLSYKKVKEKKIIVTNSKLINTESVFNLIILYLLDTTRKLLINKKKYKNRNEYEKTFLNTKDFTKQKILVLGYGNVAKKIHRFSNFNKLNTNFFSRRKNIIKKNKKIFVSSKKIKNLVKNYDTIINLLPNNEINKEFLGKKMISKFKKNVSLILVGRQESIDLKYLKKFLAKNKKSSCYFDAIQKSDNKRIFGQISNLKNTFISPHIGGYSHGYWPKQFDLFNNNLKLFKRKKKLINVVKISKHNFS